MKALFIIILFGLFTKSLFSQQAQQQQTIRIDKRNFNLVEEMTLREQMLDTVFFRGTVNFKDGSVSNAFLNYNLITNSIFYLSQSNVVMELTGLSDIKSIKYRHRHFEPISSEHVAELVESFKDGSKLFLQREVSVRTDDKRKNVFGTSAITTITDWNEQADFLEANGEVEVDITQTTKYYWVKDDKVHHIRNFRSFRSIYPEKWDDLRQYAKNQNVDMTAESHIINIIRYCVE